MEAILKVLFDYQRFAGNPVLADLIADTENRCMLDTCLLEDDLLNINAAGDPDKRLPPEKPDEP